MTTLLKRPHSIDRGFAAPDPMMDSARRDEILEAYTRRGRGFAEIASSRAHTTRRFLEAQAQAYPQRGPETVPDPVNHYLSARGTGGAFLLAEGLSNPEVGSKLAISIEMVKSHVQRILRSLGAHNRAHAVKLAYQHGLLNTEAPAPSATTAPSAGERRSRCARSSPAADLGTGNDARPDPNAAAAKEPLSDPRGPAAGRERG